MKTVYAIHTGPVLVDVLRKLFSEMLPDVHLVNVVDDSLLADVRDAGSLNSAVSRRIVGYGLIAASAGADAIFNCCSSVGEAADTLARLVEIPVVKIDDRMASRAVELGPRIGVVATLATTLDPTERLIHCKAVHAGRQIETTRYVADSAFDAILAGNVERHDVVVRETIEHALEENDVVVLAQGSMARLVPLIQDHSSVPILSSPRLGIEALREALGLT
jgi:Asp/Glu/hydantoin racemase